MRKIKLNKGRTHTSTVLDEFMSLGTPKELKRIEQNMLLANYIYDSMKAKGLNQKQFAELMGGKQPSEISRWLSGSHVFTSDTLFDISEVLGIDLINFCKPEKEVQIVWMKKSASDNINSPVSLGEIGIIPINDNEITPYTFTKNEC